jgi:hypothetical protein
MMQHLPAGLYNVSSHPLFPKPVNVLAALILTSLSLAVEQDQSSGDEESSDSEED